MPTEPEPERVDTTQSHATNERRLIEEAQRDICGVFPRLSVERVRLVVECLWAEFDDARIRDFIPVLVRKQAREELRDEFHAEASDTTATTRWVAGASTANGAWDHAVSTPSARSS